MPQGYVYILINAAMPGYIKIGRTDRSSNLRAAELSATTGIPTPFVVAFDLCVSDSVEVEQRIHQHFSKQRASTDREFFMVSLQDAIRVLTELALKYTISTNSTNVTRLESNLGKSSSCSILDSVSSRPTYRAAVAPVRKPDYVSIKPSSPAPVAPVEPVWELVSENGDTVVKRQQDLNKNQARYMVTQQIKDVHIEFLGWRVEYVISKWVPIHKTLEQAMAESQINTGPGGRITHYDGFGGNYSKVVTCDDGSCRSKGFRSNPMVTRWDELAKCQAWQHALNLADEMILSYPQGGAGFQKKAYSLHKLGRSQEAKETLLSVVDRFESNYLLLIDIARYECSLRQLSNAKEWLKRAKRIAGRSKVQEIVVNYPELVELRRYVSALIWW